MDGSPTIERGIRLKQCIYWPGDEPYPVGNTEIIGVSNYPPKENPRKPAMTASRRYEEHADIFVGV